MPIMSVSRFTSWPAVAVVRVVTVWVCGVIQRVMASVCRSATVRLMPSMVMLPRGMMLAMWAEGTAMWRRWSCPRGS